MKILKLGVMAFILASIGSNPVFAQTDDSLAEELETVPNKKLEERGERIRGPITSIKPAGLLFASFDKNADYSVDKNEFVSGQAASFQRADTDKSGSLSLFELEDWRKAALGSLDAAPANLAFDKNYDQRVTSDEFNKALDYVYNISDKDGDSTLSFEEMVRVFEMPRRGRIGEGQGARGNQDARGNGNRQQRPRGGGRR